MKVLTSTLAVWFLSLVFSSSAFGQLPGFLLYDGVLKDDETGEIIAGPIDFVLEVYASGDPAASTGKCILYKENHNAVAIDAEGGFSIKFGAGIVLHGGNLSTVLVNGPLFDCEGSGDYQTTAGESRFFRVKIVDGGETVTLSPDIEVGSVPTAMLADNAMMLNGKSDLDLIQVNQSAGNQLTQANVENVFSDTNFPILSNILTNGVGAGDIVSGAVDDTHIADVGLSKVSNDSTCTDGQIVKWDNTAGNFVCINAGGGGDMLAANDLSEVNDANARTNLGLGTAAVKNTGTATGNVVLLDATGLPAVDGSQLTNLTAGNISGALAVGNIPALSGSNITDLSIDNADIAADAITTGKILDGTITAADIAAGVLDGSSSTTNVTFNSDSDGNSTGIIDFQVNGVTKMVVHESGSVGIGTNTPSVELDVVGDIVTSGYIAMKSQGQAKFKDLDNTNHISVKAPTDVTADYVLTLPGDDGVNGEVLSTDGSGVLNWVAVGTGDINEGGNSLASNMTIGTNDSFDLILEANNTAAMSIKPNGDIGIGTATPSGKLDIEGGDVFIGNGTLDNPSAGDDLLVTGNLEVDGALYGDGSNLTGIVATSGGDIKAGGQAGAINIGSTDSPVTIDSNGFTGIHLNGATAAIGSTVIDAGLALDVSGKIGATEYCLDDGTGCITHATLNNKLDGGVNPGVLNLGSTDSPVTIDSNGFTGIHLNGATAAIGSTVIDAGLALDVSGKIGATEYCLDDGTGCITHATLNNKLDGGVNPGVLNLGSTDSPVTIDSNGFTGIHLNGATAAIGSTVIDAGLALDVSGKIGATEYCLDDGTGCITHATLNNKLDGGVNPGVLNLGSTDSPVTIDSNGFTGIHLNGATAAIGSTVIDAGLALDVSGKIGATEYCLDDGTGCITHATLSNKLDGGVNPGVLNLGSTDSPVTIDSNGFTGIHLNGATAAIGSTVIDAGLALDVSGKIGATEICQDDGTGCIPIASLGGGPTVYDFGSLNADDTGTHFIDGANGEFQKVNLTGGSPGQSAVFQTTAPANLIPGQVYTLYVTNGAPEERAIEFNHGGYDFLDPAETKIHIKNGEFATIQMVADTTTTLKFVSASLRDEGDGKPLIDLSSSPIDPNNYNAPSLNGATDGGYDVVTDGSNPVNGTVVFPDPAGLEIGKEYIYKVKNNSMADVLVDFYGSGSPYKYKFNQPGYPAFNLASGGFAEFVFEATAVNELTIVRSNQPLARDDRFENLAYTSGSLSVVGNIREYEIERTSGGNLQFNSPAGMVAGEEYRMRIKNTSGAAFDITFVGPGKYVDQSDTDLANITVQNNEERFFDFVAVEFEKLQLDDNQGGPDQLNDDDITNALAPVISGMLAERYFEGDKGFAHGFKDQTYIDFGTSTPNLQVTSPMPGETAGVTNSGVITSGTGGDWTSHANITHAAEQVTINDTEADDWAFWTTNGDLTGQFSISFRPQYASAVNEVGFGLYHTGLTPNTDATDAGFPNNSNAVLIRNGQMKKRGGGPGFTLAEGGTFTWGINDTITLKRNSFNKIEVYVNGALQATSVAVFPEATYRFFAGRVTMGGGVRDIHGISRADNTPTTVTLASTGPTIVDFPNQDIQSGKFVIVVEEMGSAITSSHFDRVEIYEDNTSVYNQTSTALHSALREFRISKKIKAFVLDNVDMTSHNGTNGDLKYQIDIGAGVSVKVIAVSVLIDQ